MPSFKGPLTKTSHIVLCLLFVVPCLILLMLSVINTHTCMHAYVHTLIQSKAQTFNPISAPAPVLAVRKGETSFIFPELVLAQAFM